MYTVKPVLSGHSNIDKTKFLMTNCTLMRSKVLQNAPLLQNAPRGAFCNTFDLHSAIKSLENHFLIVFRVAISDRFYRTVKHTIDWSLSTSGAVTLVLSNVET